MAATAPRLVARLMWIVPAILVFLVVYQTKTAFDLRKTVQEGIPAVAEITALETTARAEISYDYLNLRIPLPDGTVIERERLSIPHAYADFLEGAETVNVRVLPGAAQEVVLAEVRGQNLGRAQWRMSAIFAAMAFVGLMMAVWGVAWWNRYLARRGDPAEAPQHSPGATGTA